MTARSDGVSPTGMMVTASEAVSITETEAESRFITYARLPSRDTATFVGPGPTGIVPATVLVAVSITDTRSRQCGRHKPSFAPPPRLHPPRRAAEAMPA